MAAPGRKNDKYKKKASTEGQREAHLPRDTSETCRGKRQRARGELQNPNKKKARPERKHSGHENSGGLVCLPPSHAEALALDQRQKYKATDRTRAGQMRRAAESVQQEGPATTPLTPPTGHAASHAPH
ncbi:uncharacterized protein Tco025E_01246 [Trypanosoma conorhini]|uniref:Uncharacterized protein n=1 Tax=Trypanosoma conorhini TaxID=83891 RepID=A0A3R7LDS8_9TRYP|nr:uncharacterized protein Tco025E_01246 [Trypanosoma conorhini]RNF26385.1 hypothetical protein Tco025E_01246 [Trypanosoma conorhini]